MAQKGFPSDVGWGRSMMPVPRPEDHWYHRAATADGEPYDIQSEILTPQRLKRLRLKDCLE